MNKKRILSLLLAVSITAAVFAGCKPRVDEVSESSTQSSKPESSQSSEAAETPVSSIIVDHLDEVEEKHGENDDTIGWLQVPGTNVDDVVLQNAEDKTNNYYLRLDFNKNNHFNGVYYADFRGTVGDGSREQLSSNLCIYGHAMTDDPNNEKYDIKFGELHNFRDPELAKEMPYLFFSTAKENMAFEVVAVFIANSDNTDFVYNNGTVTTAEFAKLVREEALPRSIYNYDTEINDDDKFITLSTCVYKLHDGTPTNYPKTYYRYAILAKLVPDDAPLKTEATFTINENVLMDPATKMSK